MRQAVHIFLKDSRHLRYVIGILVAWLAIFLASSAAWVPPYQQVATVAGASSYVVPTLSAYLLPVIWWYLIAQAFHAEALPGDRQFWLTRPYHRGSLFGAKVLFVLAYVTVPLALAQGAVVVLLGLPFGPQLPGLVWTQVLVLAVVVFPAAALASLTSTLAQFVGAAVAAPVLLLAYRNLPPWDGLDWVRSGVAIVTLAAASGSALFLQFTRRRTRASRILGLGGVLALVVLLPLLPWQTAFALQAKLDDHWDGSVAAELVPPAPRPARQPDPTLLPLAFRITGPPTGTPVVCNAWEIAIDTPAGPLDTGLVGSRSADTPSTVPAECDVRLPMPRRLRDRIGDDAITLHATLYVTIFGPERSARVPIGQAPTYIPNLGACAGSIQEREVYSARSGTVTERVTHAGCLTAFRGPRNLVRLSVEGATPTLALAPASYSPFPASLTIYPAEYVGFTALPPADAMTVTARDVVGHVRAVVDVPGLRLQDF